MKKLSYMFLAFALCVGVVSCNNKDDDGEAEILGTLVNISAVDPESGESAFIGSLAYPKFKNQQGERITAFTYAYSSEGKNKAVDFTAVNTAGKCTVKYYDENNSENIEVRYTLNANGYPTLAESFYMSDGTKFGNCVFTYEGAMLTKIVDNNDPDNVRTLFEATYANSDMTTISAAGELMDVTAGFNLNNFGLAPDYLLSFMGVAPMDDAAALAACLNLLPHAKHMIGGLSMGDASIAVTQTIEQGSLVNYVVEGIMKVDFLYLY